MNINIITFYNTDLNFTPMVRINNNNFPNKNEGSGWNWVRRLTVLYEACQAALTDEDFFTDNWDAPIK